VCREEAQLNPALIDDAVRLRRVLDLRALSARDLVEPYVFIDRVPEGAVVLDCRPRHLYDAWHYPGARHRTPEQVSDGLRTLEKEKTYVLCCEIGLRTAPIAELLQRLGYDAYPFRGALARSCGTTLCLRG